MDKNFKLYSYILDFDDYTRKYVANCIPSVDRDVRIHLLDEIYNLEKSNYTSERALELYKEKVINSDKDIYVLIDSKKSKYKLYALEQNGFEIAEIVAEYDVNTLHFLEASNIVQLVKVKYVGI